MSFGEFGGPAPEVVAIDVETTGFERFDELVCAAVAYQFPGDSKVYRRGFWLDRSGEAWRQGEAEFSKLLQATLFNPSFPGVVVFHELNFDLKMILLRFRPDRRFKSTDYCALRDSAAISRLSKNNKYLAHADPLKRKSHSLKYLAWQLLGVKHDGFEEVVGQANIRLTEPSRLLEYNQQDALLTVKVYNKLMQEVLTPEEARYAVDIESKYILDIFHINWNGLNVDKLGAEAALVEAMEYVRNIETEIFKAVGRTFNINSNRDLAGAIFWNSNFIVKDLDGTWHPLRPPYETEAGSVRVNGDTIRELKRRIYDSEENLAVVRVLDLVIQHSEVSKTIAKLEELQLHSQGGGLAGHIYPRLKAEALSGRVTCAKPNLLGYPKKVFKRSDASGAPATLKDLKVRSLFTVTDGFTGLSTDVNGLDLTVIANGAIKYNPNFSWKNFFEKYEGHTIDTHLAVLSEVDPCAYERIFKKVSLNYKSADYLLSKPKEGKITLIPRARSGPVHSQLIEPEIEEEISQERAVWKVVNLAVPYAMGAQKLAAKLRENTNESWGVFAAQEKLQTFHSVYPEIGRFQDELANLVYHQGYASSPFGKKIFSKVFDDLNENARRASAAGAPDSYEFICKISGRYWHLKVSKWLKEDGDVLSGFQWIRKPGGLRFGNLLSLQPLDSCIFRIPQTVVKASKFKRKTESNLDEVMNYELSRIQITQECDRLLSEGSSIGSEERDVLDSLIRNGTIFIPEARILFYRVPLTDIDPSMKYFRAYDSLEKIARKFFPQYCQSVATCVAKQCLTKVREEIERLDLDANIMMFLHDQIDIMVRLSDKELGRLALQKAVESKKDGFGISLTGTIKEANSLQ